MALYVTSTAAAWAYLRWFANPFVAATVEYRTDTFFAAVLAGVWLAAAR